MQRSKRNRTQLAKSSPEGKITLPTVSGGAPGPGFVYDFTQLAHMLVTEGVGSGAVNNPAADHTAGLVAYLNDLAARITAIGG
jgi:hypothetical protein